MKYCTYCGAEIHGLENKCPSCGQPCNDMTGVPDFTQIWGTGQGAETLISGWVGWLLLCGLLPVVGPCITLCSTRDIAVKNFAKAWLVLTLCGIILMFAGIVALAALSFVGCYI